MNQNLTANTPKWKCRGLQQLRSVAARHGTVGKMAATQTSCRKSRYLGENCSNSDKLPQVAVPWRKKVQNAANLKLALHAYDLQLQ